MEAYPIELTKLECIYLSDALSMFGQGPPGASDQGPYPDLLLKILSAFLEVGSGSKEGSVAVVQLSQADLWVIREVAKSSVTMGSQPVGLLLLVKVAKGLLALTARSEVNEAVALYGRNRSGKEISSK